MRILLVHNFYQQPGGEDRVFAAEAALLREHGHEVIEYTEHNERIAGRNRLGAVLGTAWSTDAHHKLSRLLRTCHVDVAHFHNTLPLISPSAYYACRGAGVPVVQTLHNYRTGCPKALLHRDGRICEDCLGRQWAWPGIVHGCYRGSRAGTAVLATAYAAHRLVGTWRDAVDVYIALTQFSRGKQIAAGIPREKIEVKPNFVHPDPGPGAQRERGAFALFVGRLSPEKGAHTLLRAWQTLGASNAPPLKIVGDGPLRHDIQHIAARAGLEGAIQVLGHQPRATVMELLQKARLLLFPSECYENFPMAIVEAFACGTPVLATRLGAMAEIVDHNRTGLLFAPGDPLALAEAVSWAHAHTAEMEQLGDQARAQYVEQYGAQRNLDRLLEIYALAAGRVGQRAVRDR